MIFWRCYGGLLSGSIQLSLSHITMSHCTIYFVIPLLLITFVYHVIYTFVSHVTVAAELKGAVGQTLQGRSHIGSRAKQGAA